MDILFGVFTLIFLDVVLSIDNAILIASTTRNLEEKERKIASIIGAAGAVLLRLIFIILVMLVLEQLSKVPVIYIAGGGILIWLGISLTFNKKNDGKELSKGTGILKAIALIMAGDVMLSFDNAFIIGDIVNGFDWSKYDFSGREVLILNITIIVIALLVSLIIIIFFADVLGKLMHKYQWIIYIAAWLLVSVGIEMTLKDYLWNIIADSNSENELILEEILQWGMNVLCYSIGGIIIFSKWFFLDRKKDTF